MHMTLNMDTLRSQMLKSAERLAKTYVKSGNSKDQPSALNDVGSALGYTDYETFQRWVKRKASSEELLYLNKVCNRIDIAMKKDK